MNRREERKMSALGLKIIKLAALVLIVVPEPVTTVIGLGILAGAVAHSRRIDRMIPL